MKLLITTLFLVPLLFAHGQQWALPSSTWLCTSFDEALGAVTFTMQIEKDTVVANIPCKKFNRPGYYTQPGDLFTYTANDTVFFYLNGRFRATYYFNALVGDTVSYFDGQELGSGGDTTVEAVVFLIDTVTIGGQSLRSFHTAILPESNGQKRVQQDTLVYTEKIGCYSVYPQFWHVNTFDEVIDLICDYGDTTIAGFYASLNQGCLSGISYVSPGDYRFEMYPNPSVNRLTIVTDNTQFNNVLIIRDFSGNIVYETKLTAANTQLTTEVLPNGFYFVSISNGVDVKTRKLIIER